MLTNFIIVLGQQNVLQSSYLLCIFPNAIIRLAGYEIGFFFVQQFTAIHTAKVMACMNKLFNIHASAVMAARDHAEKQINGKSKQMFWFMTDFETKTVSLACKRCKLQVRYLKSGDLKSTQNWIWFLFSKKFKNRVHFFTCILPDYVAHDISKEFLENSHFKDTTAGFLLRCQNLFRLIPPKMMHFQAWKKNDSRK